MLTVTEVETGQKSSNVAKGFWRAVRKLAPKN